MSAELQAGIEEETAEEAQEENEEEAEGQAEEEDEDEEKERGIWQDDQCSTITAQERTGTKLCNACAKIFRPNRKRNADVLYRHIEYLDTLERSASQGCELCNYVLRRLRIEYSPAPELGMMYILTELAVSLDPPKPESFRIAFYFNCYSGIPGRRSLVKQGIYAFVVGMSYFESLLSCSIGRLTVLSQR